MILLIKMYMPSCSVMDANGAPSPVHLGILPCCLPLITWWLFPMSTLYCSSLDLTCLAYWKFIPIEQPLPMSLLGFPGGSVVKNPSVNAGDSGSIPWLGGSPGDGNANPLQYPCLGNPMDRQAWQATVYEVTKSQTRLTNVSAPGKYHSTLGFYEYDCFVKRVELMLNELFIMNKTKPIPLGQRVWWYGVRLLQSMLRASINPLMVSLARAAHSLQQAFIEHLLCARHGVSSGWQWWPHM